MTQSQKNTFHIEDDRNDHNKPLRLYKEICSKIDKSDKAKHKRKMAVDLLQNFINSSNFWKKIRRKLDKKRRVNQEKVILIKNEFNITYTERKN